MLLQEDCRSTELRVKMDETLFNQLGESVAQRLDAIYDWCETHYNKGQWILETMTPMEVLMKFDTIGEARRYCRIIEEQHQEVRNA